MQGIRRDLHQVLIEDRQQQQLIAAYAERYRIGDVVGGEGQFDGAGIARQRQKVGGNDFIHQRIQLAVGQRVVHRLAVGEADGLFLLRHQPLSQIALQHADALAGQIAPGRDAVGILADVNAPQRTVDRHAGAIARLDAARQRQGGAEAGLAGLHQLIGLLGVARPQRRETQPGVLRDDVENIDGVAARLAVGTAVGEREVVLDGGIVNHAVARHPILLHRRQIGIAGIEVAGDLFAPAALQGIHQFHRRVGDGGVQRVYQARVGGGEHEGEVAQVLVAFNLIELAELQLVDDKAGAGLVGDKVVAAAVEQRIDRLQVVVVALDLRRHRLQGAAGLHVGQRADRDAGVGGIEHHRPIVAAIAQYAQVADVVRLGDLQPVQRFALRDAVQQIDLAVVQRLFQLGQIGEAVNGEADAGHLLDIAEVVGVQPIQIVVDDDVVRAGVLTDDADAQRAIALGIFLADDQHILGGIQVADQLIAHRLRRLRQAAPQDQQQQGAAHHGASSLNTATSSSRLPAPVLRWMFFCAC